VGAATFWTTSGAATLSTTETITLPETNRLDDVLPRPTVFNVATAEIPSSMMAMVL